MLDLDEVNPHLALWRSETAESPEEVAYGHWVGKLEHALGHNLDGDQDADGYSLDTAFDFFSDGLTIAEAEAEFEELIRLSKVRPSLQELYPNLIIED